MNEINIITFFEDKSTHIEIAAPRRLEEQPIFFANSELTHYGNSFLFP